MKQLNLANLGFGLSIQFDTLRRVQVSMEAER